MIKGLEEQGQEDETKLLQTRGCIHDTSRCCGGCGTVPSPHQTVQSDLQDLSVPSTRALLQVNDTENLVCDSLL